MPSITCPHCSKEVGTYKWRSISVEPEVQVYSAIRVIEIYCPRCMKTVSLTITPSAMDSLARNRVGIQEPD